MAEFPYTSTVMTTKASSLGRDKPRTLARLEQSFGIGNRVCLRGRDGPPIADVGRGEPKNNGIVMPIVGGAEPPVSAKIRDVPGQWFPSGCVLNLERLIFLDWSERERHWRQARMMGRVERLMCGAYWE